MVLKDINRVLRTAHVATLSNELCASLDKRLGLLAGNFVLCRTRKNDIHILDVGPRAHAVNVLAFALELRGGGDFSQLLTLDLEFGNQADFIGGDALLISGDQSTLAVGEGDDGCAQLDGFESGVLCDVSRAGDSDAFALEGLFPA